MKNYDDFITNENICCQNDFCIYQKNGHCILGSIELNTFGACDSCIYISINSNQLKAEKIKQLNKFHN